MKFILLGILLSIQTPLIAKAQQIDFNRLSEAINRAENSKKYPYGIKSINTLSDASLAKRICLNTIKHQFRLWNHKQSFIEFLSMSYAPVASSPLNKNWSKNVTYFYETK